MFVFMHIYINHMNMLDIYFLWATGIFVELPGIISADIHKDIIL